MNSSLGIIISFCTNELCFIDAVLREASLISNDIVVSYGDKFFNGEDQDLSFLDEYTKKYPHVKWAQYNIDVNADKRLPNGKINTLYYFCLTRWAAIQKLDDSSKWVLVIDADEIPEGVKFNQLYKSLNPQSDHCYKIGCYWYYKDVKFQAKNYEDSILLIEKNQLVESNVFTEHDRDGMYQTIPRNLIHKNIMGEDKLPVFHHFSFVRKGKEGLEKKLVNWGHLDLLNCSPEAFANYIHTQDNIVRDPIHNYTYNIVENIFNIQI